ncbi:hypothetical protein B5807_00668 [Epicoccum nigrum]|jgi:hypothetical protein|uniref:Uncharacterized protein n=1 Tax=Epicoccum nigrum TaxID=105696 RepID=A0A1Y2MDN7_EPING|nr:hypothetical protein B5807_00668 [Epicoccum nigrum]
MDQKSNSAAPTPPRQNDDGLALTPALILVALTTALTCWLLTGIIGHTSPALPAQDDMTLMCVFLWIPQALATGCLVYTAQTRGWFTPAATLSASIVGVGAAIMYGVCWADWGNAATYAFWIAAGIYGAMGAEAWLGVAGAAEVEIGRAMGA